MTRRHPILAVLAVACVVPAPALAQDYGATASAGSSARAGAGDDRDGSPRRRAQISPYIEAGQVLTADLSGGDSDVLTYSTLSAGIDASIQTRRVQVSVGYEYEHRFSYDDRIDDGDVHSGLARAAVGIAPGFSIEAGGIATRARSDVRGDAPTNLAGNTSNVSQIYSAYAGPTLATRIGPFSANASYRFGYTRVEAPGATGVPAGQPALDLYDDSTSHLALASIGTRAGTILPVGVTVSGAWQRESAGQLDQRYEGRYARGDVVLPVGRGLALVAGAGYENIEISQRDPVVDTTTGQPVVDANGRLVTDESAPRRIAYDTDGLFWDAGVVYRPSRRLTLEARAGRRYGSMSYTGSLSYQVGRASGLQIGVYDSITSFGRQLGNGLASLPTNFTPAADPFGNQYNGCVFTGSGAAGGCLNGVFQSIATANYRARGVDAVFAVNRGPLRMGVGAGYANRKFIAPEGGPGFSVNGVVDESYYAQVFAARQVGRNGSLSGNFVANYYESGLPGADGVFGWGANAAYSHSFGRLGATAAVGIFGYGAQEADNSVAAQALLSLRYGF